MKRFRDNQLRNGPKFMKRLGLIVLFTLTMQTASPADVTKLAEQNRKALQDATRFHEVLVTKELPADIVALCTGGTDRMADPGEKWRVTDVIMEPSLPIRRLIWAATDGEYYVVHYERGGIAHSFHIMIAKVAKKNAQLKLIWRGAGARLKDYAAFLDALRGEQLDDRADYAY
jgi:hypothetical protein